MSQQNSKIGVSFILSGEEIVLDEISDQLSLMPTHTRSLEDWPEVIKIHNAELPNRIKPHYEWEIDIGYEDSRLVRERFKSILELLKGKEAIINKLIDKYSLSASFVIGIHAQHDDCNMPEVFLTQEIINLVASLRADISFNMWLD